jgi:hypothetical protein
LEAHPAPLMPTPPSLETRLVKSKSFKNSCRSAAIIFLAFCALFLLSCGEDSDPRPHGPSLGKTEGFTFFDLTAESRLTSELRKNLEKKLGSDAITRKSPLDLMIAPEPFAREHFPEIDDLNQRLNYSPRERIEHNVTKLMYRYPVKKQQPFSFVELIFSNYTDKPLVFHTSAKQEGATVIQTLEDKYGAPRVSEWDKGRQRALYWRKEGELMVVYALRDRFGNPEYQVQLLFLDAIEELLRTEEKEREAREEKKKEAVRDAF